jgi:hypothetical protein
MKDDHEERAINLQTAIAKAQAQNLPTSCHILSMAWSEVWRVPGHVGINDNKIHQKRRTRALFLPRT